MEMRLTRLEQKMKESAELKDKREQLIKAKAVQDICKDFEKINAVEDNGKN